MIKSRHKIKNVYEVAVQRLCLGCGACVYGCKDGKVHLEDIIDDGLRPIIENLDCGACDRCLELCPGLNYIHWSKHSSQRNLAYQDKHWGNLLEVWEGYASDPEIRHKGSSGGLCTALSLFCIETKHATKVLHIGANGRYPWKNKTYLSRSREELISRTGSRYSPASPCDGLADMERSTKPSVFVGKPCDVAGLRMAQKLSQGLAAKTYLAIGFFCAGTPSSKGTLEFLKVHNIDLDEIEEFRYRGKGWPGMATVKTKGKEEAIFRASYQDSWGFVQKYRPFRCYLCPDLTAEFADISVGDPWYREIGDDDPGRSLILIRTDRGRDIFHRAMKQEYVTAERADPEIIYQSQKNLLRKRQAIWGRFLAMRLFGIPTPKYEGFNLFENWIELPVKEKIRSVLGTTKRIISRKYYKPLNYH